MDGVDDKIAFNSWFDRSRAWPYPLQIKASFQQRMMQDSTCELCGGEPETASHLIFHRALDAGSPSIGFDTPSDFAVHGIRRLPRPAANSRCSSCTTPSFFYAAGSYGNQGTASGLHLSSGNVDVAAQTLHTGMQERSQSVEQPPTGLWAGSRSARRQGHAHQMPHGDWSPFLSRVNSFDQR